MKTLLLVQIYNDNRLSDACMMENIISNHQLSHSDFYRIF